MNSFDVIAMVIIWVFVKLSSAHSWVECSDYAMDGSLKSYERNKCRGFARDMPTYDGKGFGIDRGFNYQADGKSLSCISNKTERSYNSEYPMAEYSPGEMIRFLHPAKNHVADSCTNPYIPDTKFELYMLCGSQESNMPLDTFLEKAILVQDYKSNNGKGYQQCPHFCENMDKAICYHDFKVPQASGHCMFLVYWIFNPNTSPYTMCFDATIENKSPPEPLPTNLPDPQVTSPPENHDHSKQCYMIQDSVIYVA